MELRVFLVEDLQSMRGLIDELFTSIGGLRLTGVVSTEAEAKLWLQENVHGWDIAVVDLVLEQGSGLNVIRTAKEQGGKVVVFSSFATPGIHAHCVRLGADAVFDKHQTAPFVLWIREQVELLGAQS